MMCYVAAMTASAQIGYQVSLLNNATGEPRANERVTVTVKITDSNGNVVCEETKNENTNDFGVVSMSVGNDDTFANADWANLPFFIEATVDNHLIGKSQLLSVPVAEYAKHTGTLTKEILCSKTWIYYYNNGDYKQCTFNENGGYTLDDGSSHEEQGTYVIDGNIVYIFEEENYGRTFTYSEKLGLLIEGYDVKYFR